jgi:stage II sporulation protein D
VRYLLLLLAHSLWAEVADLSPYFQGRSGAALLWDLEAERLVGAYQEGRAQSLQFRPGSLLKPFSLAAFVEAGLYQESFRVRCEAGMLNGPEALAYSCNEYFERALGMMEGADLTRGYARFGLDARMRQTTLSGLLAAWRRLVGRYQEARMGPVFRGMEQSVAYGTGRLAGVAAVQVAGKTGTMQEAALFAGYAPAGKPRYLLLVHLDNGSGGGDAAPVAAKIFAGLFQPKSVFDPRRVSVRLFWQSQLKALNLEPGEYGAGTLVKAGESQLVAPGPIRVEKKEGRYLVTASVAMEDYVAAVLHGEAGGFRQGESRKAMAVAARTYAARFRGRHAEEGFDFCDTTHCQDARFVARARGDLVSAVEDTEGEMLWWQGKPAAAYYHADSGGWLEGSSEGSYLRAKKDVWWEDVPTARWTWTVGVKELAAALHLTLIRPDFRVTAREASGRARALDVFGHPAEAAAFRMAVGRQMGWEKLPSRLFEVVERDRKLVFTGRGRGHGMGLAQTSAERMGAAGKGYREILGEYYPGAKVSISASGLQWQTLRGARVSLWTVNAGRDRSLLGEAERELLDLERMTGMRVEPVLRVYPSREAFRDATGILEAVQGATRGRQVRLMAGAKRGTLRHELLHAVLETNTKGVWPGWLREGMVLALLGEAGEGRERVEGLIGKYGRGEVLRMWREGDGRLGR